MTVQELYKEQKFSAVIYYLNQNGFFSLADLETFDFDSLLFVPGIDESITYEASNDLELNKSCDKDEDSLVGYERSNGESCVIDSDGKTDYSNLQDHIETCVFLLQKLKDTMI